jgi:hypothetical protein
MATPQFQFRVFLAPLRSRTKARIMAGFEPRPLADFRSTAARTPRGLVTEYLIDRVSGGLFIVWLD